MRILTRINKMGFRNLFNRNEKKLRNVQIEKQNLKMELTLLREQFISRILYNCLHTVEVVIKHNPGKALEYLPKLSELLHYMMYETHAERISLQKEIVQLENYIALKTTQFTDADCTRFTKEGNFEGVTIVPLLLIPFVDNAFKYFNFSGDNAIIIRLVIDNNQMYFYCSNNFLPNQTANPSGEIDLDEVRHRLDLLYNRQYTLTISDKNYIFETELTLDLSQ